MIFVTVGTQLPFDRLLRAVDAWAGAHPDVPVEAQTGRVGPGGYQPRHMSCTAAMAPDRFERVFRSADLVIAHAGTGSLLQASATGRPILIMPRRAAMGEHRNDHQMATVAHFADHAGVNIAYEEGDVAPAIDRLLSAPPQPPVFPDTADPTLIAAIRARIFPDG